MISHQPQASNETYPGREGFKRSPLSVTLSVVGIGFVILFLALGDLAELIPGHEELVASPFFPFFHEGHDIVALILSLYIAHRLTPRSGLLSISWFLVLHIPYIYIKFPDELPELFRLLLMTGAAFFGVHIIQLRRQLERQLEEQAMRDPLTGLLNHLHFHKELEFQLAVARRYDELGAVLFLDLDGFKAVNDRLGHQAGDDLLIRVAFLLQHHLRASDSVARMGGDEFAALLPHTDIRQAHVAAERVGKAINAERINDSFPVSASMGLVAYPDAGDTAKSLLAYADRAMYQAKAEGGNRLVVFAKEARYTLEQRTNLGV